MERFLDYFCPEHYTLKLKLNHAKTKMSGETIIIGEAKRATVKLHAVDMTVKKVLLDNQATEFKHEDGVIVIENVALGQHEIRVEYNFEITGDMQGAYLSTYKLDGEEQRIVSTQFESHYARECFPCVDEPAAKAIFELKLTSEDGEDTIISNMPAELTTMQDGVKTVSFAPTPRMSTYLVAFAFGKFVSYESESRHGIKITTYAGLHQSAKDLEFAGNFAAEVLDFYDDRFKTPFPLPKLDLLALPDFEAGAMENWGLVTYREIALLANEKSALDQKLYVCTVVAHELSHMWFGDLVTMEWWNDLWLNESFANLMETYSVAQLRPDYGAWDDYYSSTVLAALRRDCLPGVQPVRVDVENVEDIANLFDGAIVYAKGSRIMLMLMRTIGEENFFAGLAKYFDKHKYGNTTADDLWDAMSEYVDFDVREFMTQWLIQSGYPVVEGKKQERFLLTGKKDDSKYPIRELRDDLSGHYLIKLSDKEFEEKLANISALNKEQKLRLLIDRQLLAKTEHVSSASLLPLLKAFEKETDSVIWDIISVIINDLKIFFEPESSAAHDFKAFVKSLAEYNYQRLGIKACKEDTEDDIRTRAIVMGLMAYSDDEEFSIAIQHTYGDADINNIDTDLRGVISVVLIKNNDALSEDYYNIYKNTPNVELKSDMGWAVTSTRSRKTGAAYLKDLKNGTIRPQDRLGFYIRLVRNYITKKEALDWMYENWDWLFKEEGEKTIAMYPRYVASTIRTEEEAKTFREFFNKYINEKILNRDVTVAFADIDSRLKLIAADELAVMEAVKQYI